MPPRDEQDYESKRVQIMDAALEVFARHGFERATNKDIARAANIKSPGLIYHYFKDKTDLLKHVIERYVPALQLFDRPGEFLDRPPEEVLPQFASAFTQALQHRPAIATFKLVLGESIRKPAVADMFNRLGPSRGFGFLVTYLERQMELGRLRRMDPGAAARCFVGPMVVFILTREVFPQPDSKTLQPSEMVETLVEVYLRGMAPDPRANALAAGTPEARRPRRSRRSGKQAHGTVQNPGE
ncbi:MAG TPA: TetR/AcrR family transcriptional regulator [Chloroflexia bacterium]|nr:TetR/AcrR family transcriptional regulator [Chloroflexia bacterium]